MRKSALTRSKIKSKKKMETTTRQHFYKSGKKITIRKPRSMINFIPFIASYAKTKGMNNNTVKNFLKHVVTDVKELNFIKNDVCFLMNEMYGKDLVNCVVPYTDGIIFYIWVYLPYSFDMSKYSSTKDIRDKVFPFDLFYARKNITEKDCKKIEEILLKDVDVKLYHRKPMQTPVLPFEIKAIL